MNNKRIESFTFARWQNSNWRKSWSICGRPYFSCCVCSQLFFLNSNRKSIITCRCVAVSKCDTLMQQRFSITVGGIVQFTPIQWINRRRREHIHTPETVSDSVRRKSITLATEVFASIINIAREKMNLWQPGRRAVWAIRRCFSNFVCEDIEPSTQAITIKCTDARILRYVSPPGARFTS